MKKACSYCGKIHDRGYHCGRKPEERTSGAESFRATYDWKTKSIAIRKRDQYLCVACRNELPGTVRRLNNEELSVHHIIPLKVDYSLRLDEDNLITLCRTHHEMAEAGEIPAEALLELVRDIPPGGQRKGRGAEKSTDAPLCK